MLIITIIVFIASCDKIDSLYKTKNEWLESVQKETYLKKYKLAELSDKPVVEYLLDPNSKPSISYLNNCRKVCDYAKIPFNFKTISKWNDSSKLEKSTRTLVLFDTKPIKSKTVDSIVNFVAKGGTLFILSAIEDKRFNFLIGVKPDASLEVDIVSKGVYLEGTFLPKTNKITIKEEQGNFALKGSNFNNKIKVHAWADQTKKLPVILTNTIGNGKVVYFNTGVFLEKGDRGLLFSGILNGLNGIPYPIANTNTVFLDDFPSPVYSEISEPIKSEMNLSNADFVHKVWWKDIVTLGKKYNIKYTALSTFDYDSNVTAPFLFEQWDAEKRVFSKQKEILPNWLMKQVAENGYEIGFHGYNHVSLLQHDWKDTTQLQLSFNAVKKKWLVSDFGDFPVTYVPPSNKIDAYGIHNLKKNMPSIQYLCSLYLGDRSEGEDREFDFDPYDDQIFDYPRISSGFTLEDYHRYNLQSMYIYTGIWTHFIHPDDVYQIKKGFINKNSVYGLRNKENRFWHKDVPGKKSLYSMFDEYLNDFNTLYPLSRYLAAKEAVPIVMDWRKSKYVHSQDEKKYTVEKQTITKTKANYWFVYFEKENVEKAETEIKEQALRYHSIDFLDGKLFQIESKNPHLSFSLSIVNEKGSKQKENAVAEAYKTYRVQQEAYFKGGNNEKDFLEKIEKEKKELLTKMLNESKINYQTWNKYANYLSWNNEGEQVWTLLSKHCKVNPSKHNINYSFELEKILGYPNDEIHNSWILLQYQWNPERLSILKEYLNSIITTANFEEIEKILKKIYTLEPTQKNYENYVSHLVLYNKEEAIKELRNIEPNKPNFSKELVADIAWLYANLEDYHDALYWYEYTSLLSFETKLEWLYKTRQFKTLFYAYNDYIEQHPEDYNTIAKIAEIYQTLGKHKEAWQLATSLPEGPLKETLKKGFNTEIIYLDEVVQEELLASHPEFFTENSKAYLLDRKRKKYGNFLESKSSLSTFLKDKMNFENEITFNKYDSLKNLHSFKVKHTELFPLQELETSLDNDNVFKKVNGLAYKIKKYKNKYNTKLAYYASFGAEVDQHSKLYYNVGVGASLDKKTSTTSIDLEYLPVNTSASYEKNNYNLQLRIYNTFPLSVFQLENYSESKYYTDHGIFSTSLTTRLMMQQNKKKWFRAIPFTEAFVSKSSVKENRFYPYFILKEQAFIGLGTGFFLGREEDKFTFSSYGAYYFDTFSDTFINLRGNLEYEFLKYTFVKGSYDLYFQDKYYSNTLQLGFKYIF